MSKIVFSGGSRRPGIKRGVFSKQAQKLKPPPETMGLINGRVPGSSWEWNTARALWSLNWDFMYQVSLRGGRQLLGGLVLDFLVKTNPAWTAMPVNGPHWHTEKKDEYLMRSLIDALREEGYLVRGDPVILWEEAASYETARAFIFQKIGRG
jgi:hypothetical protein